MYGERYTWHGNIGQVAQVMRDVPGEEYKEAMRHIVNWFSVDVAGHAIWRIGPDEYVIVCVLDNGHNGG